MQRFMDTLSNYIEKGNYLIFSLVYIVCGTLIFIFNNQLLQNLVAIILLILLVACIKDLLTLFTKKKWDKALVLKAILNTIVAFMALWFVRIPSAIVIMIFACYLLLNGIVKLFGYFLLKHNKIKGGMNDFIEGIIYSVFGIICFFSPVIHMETMLCVIGIYLILLGINYFFDFLDYFHIHLTHFRIPLPAIIDALIPLSVLEHINRLTDRDEIPLDFNKPKEDVDLEIFVHVSEKGMGKLGHVDLCFEGQVVSYGNYDKDTRKIYEVIGNGVVFTAPRNEYIRFCVTHSEKTLFCFGIHLTPPQKKKVKQELQEIMDNLVPWKPAYVLALEAEEEIKEEEYQDYASMLYKKTKAQFYKFKSGKYKAYFVLGTNCGALVDKILKSSGAGILKMYGIITPGTYYDFLEKEYLKKDSSVVSKQIYNHITIKKL